MVAAQEVHQEKAGVDQVVQADHLDLRHLKVRTLHDKHFQCSSTQGLRAFKSHEGNYWQPTATHGPQWGTEAQSISKVGSAYSANWNHDWILCIFCILFCIFCILVASRNVFALNCILDILFQVDIFIYILFYIFCRLDLVTYCYIPCIFFSYCAY